MYVDWTNFLGAFEKKKKERKKKEKKNLLASCPSAWKNSAPTGRIFTKFDMHF
jgi:hypothetical protein